ncbi:phosphatase PAP2 family protein [Xanthobacter sp. V4C-4]|uniref:phosphatase PAP2 family protein n=1 Tax=Xanthobacter cornucopiae TaxID=3119924 RepID=UPI00372AA35C
MSAAGVRAGGRRLAEAGRDIAAGLLGGLGDLRRRPARRPAPRVLRAGWPVIAAGVILTVAAVAAAMLLVDPLTPGLRARAPAGVVILAERLTDLGLGGVVLWPLGIALALLLVLRPHLDAMGRRVATAVIARVGFLVLCVAGAGLLVTVVKRLIGRARPHVALGLPGPDPQLTFDWLSWRASYASFPSGHATTVFATTVALAALFPRARGPLLALAAVVAATRVLLGAHYPSDVIAGAGVATLFVLWMVKLFAARRLVFRLDAEGAIAPMAGPSARRLGLLLPWGARWSGGRNGRSPIPLEEARS